MWNIESCNNCIFEFWLHLGPLYNVLFHAFFSRNKTSPTLSSPSTPVTADLLQLQDSNHQNLSIEQQRIIEEERQRLEVFVSQARAKCTNITPEHSSTSNVERSNSDGDLLQLFLPPETTRILQPSSNLFDDFFFQPSMWKEIALTEMWFR